MVDFKSLINSCLTIITASITLSTTDASFAPKTFILPSFQMITSLSTSSSNNCTSPNQLYQIDQLSNQYYALRHGQSKANIANIISSDPQISTMEHGLTDFGKDQVSTSARLFCKDYHEEYKNDDKSNSPIVAIYASDFTRARETALIFAQVLRENNVPLVFHNDNVHNEDNNSDEYDERKKSQDREDNGVQFDVRLRERYFGEFNGESDSHYQDVWDVDCIDPNHTKYGVESVNSVVQRTTKLILDIEHTISKRYNTRSSDCIRRPYKIILVAHGDVLQILQTAFLNVDGSIHRSLDHLETASVRELKLQK